MRMFEWKKNKQTPVVIFQGLQETIDFVWLQKKIKKQKQCVEKN